MAVKPIKRTGFKQSITAQSSTQNEAIGTPRFTADGRKFVYAKAGSSALSAGYLNVSAAVAADVMNEACASAHAIGDTQVAETITSATYAEDYFAGGFLQINDGTGEGEQYPIDSSSAVAASTAITVTLNESIRTALVATTSEFTLVHNPQMAVVESATLACAAGVAPRDVTASYFFWNQVAGPACVLSGNTDAVGMPLYQSTSTAGAVSGADNASYYPHIGTVMGTAGVSTEFKPVNLQIA